MPKCRKCHVALSPSRYELCEECECPPDVIAARAAEIRAEWSERERWCRAGQSRGHSPRVEITRCRVLFQGSDE